MDTKYFLEALKEYQDQFGDRVLGCLSVSELSQILQRAQQMKEAHREELAPSSKEELK